MEQFNELLSKKLILALVFLFICGYILILSGFTHKVQNLLLGIVFVSTKAIKLKLGNNNKSAN